MTRDWTTVGQGIRQGCDHWSDSLHTSFGSLLCSCFWHDHTLSGLAGYCLIMNWGEWTRWNEIRPGRGTVWTKSEEGWKVETGEW